MSEYIDMQSVMLLAMALVIGIFVLSLMYHFAPPIKTDSTRVKLGIVIILMGFVGVLATSALIIEYPKISALIMFWPLADFLLGRMTAVFVRWCLAIGNLYRNAH